VSWVFEKKKEREKISVPPHTHTLDVPLPSSPTPSTCHEMITRFIPMYIQGSNPCLAPNDTTENGGDQEMGGKGCGVCHPFPLMHWQGACSAPVHIFSETHLGLSSQVWCPSVTLPPPVGRQSIGCFYPKCQMC
jgi:hypothetical protein